MVLRERITLPRVSRPLLMFDDSLRRRFVALVRLTRSDPARSTKLNFDVVVVVVVLVVTVVSKNNVNIAWLREEDLFMLVSPVTLFLLPSASNCSACPADDRVRGGTFVTEMEPEGDSRIWIDFDGVAGLRRSRTPSLYISRNIRDSFWVVEVGGATAMVLNTAFSTLGITPKSFTPTPPSLAPPALTSVPIVYVLPEPVCPYANTVEL